MLVPTPPRTGPLSLRRPVAERRRHSRLAPTHPSRCRITQPGGLTTAALVHNLSASGAAMLCEGPLPVGCQVRLALINHTAIFHLTLDLTVLRCQPCAGGDWLVAGMFDRLLAPHELVPFFA